MSSNPSLRKKEKSSLSAPKVNDPDVQRAIEKIYEDLNKLKDGTNKSTGTDTEEYEGDPGDIRIIKTSEKLYNLEAKGEEGWVTPKIGEDVIKWHPIGSRKKYEPAKISEDGEVEEPPEAVTADNIENFTSNFLTNIDPDYDSGWVDVNRTNSSRSFRFDHDLDFETDSPRIIQWFARDSYGDYGGNPATNRIYQPQSFYYGSVTDGATFLGVDYWVNNSQVGYDSYASYWMHYIYDGTSHKKWDRMDIRVLIWK